MKLIRPSHEILTDTLPIEDLKKIEKAARVCYKSEHLIDEKGESAKKLVGSLIANGHEAMLEHAFLTVKFITDRATSHELVRHRIASFAQESQRYCNYSKDKFDSEISFIEPWWFVNGVNGIAPDGAVEFIDSLVKAEQAYFKLLDVGYKPQDARSVLPNCTKTEIVITANFREWRHILKLRTAREAAPEMRRLMRPLLEQLYIDYPVLFNDIYDQEESK